MKLLPAVAVENDLTILDGLLFDPGQPRDWIGQHPVSRVECLESHPMWKTTSHQVDRLQNLE